MNNKKESIIVYTDGSCNPVEGIGGWAAIIVSRGNKVVLSGTDTETTHQRMELTAALKSLEHILAAEGRDAEIKLYTDSEYLVNLPARKEKLEASGWLTRNKKPVRHTDLVQRLFALMDVLLVTVLKVRAHMGSSNGENFNREVDKLSRKIVRDSVRNTGRKKV